MMEWIINGSITYSDMASIASISLLCLGTIIFDIVVIGLYIGRVRRAKK